MLMRFFRKWHRWISVAITLPFGLTLITGIILTTRGFNPLVHPKHPEVKSSMPASMDWLLEIARSVPEAKISQWSDVSQIDIRPSTGNIRVRAKETWVEILVDGQTEKLVSSGVRRSSFLVSLHEGAYFGAIVRYGIFLPSALGVLFLLLSGIYIYAQPYLKRWKG